MRPQSILFVLALGAAAGCSQQTVSPPVSNTALAIPHMRTAVTITTLYNFKGSPDGLDPEAGLTPIAGRFYGATRLGGTGQRSDGTIFDVREDGTEHVLHSFTGSPDGASPRAGLANLNNVLYGTTSQGGKNGNFGTVYELKTDGSAAYRVVYNFKNAPDGNSPIGDLVAINDKLFGTTLSGGENLKGTVFEVHPDGSERVVYSFSGTPDGEGPHGGLVQLNGSMYGTTEFGGANNLGCVFEVQQNGTERVLYSFKGADSGDGAAPYAGLTVLNGLLYGVTHEGGADDYGTVFEIHEDGTERVIYSFKGSDGKFPFASLTVLKGLLYGTTIRGGSRDVGTIFEVHPDGAFRVLHSFSGTDGRWPAGTLAISGGDALVGTTRSGGTTSNGTVFRVQL
ncbi:MAG TPA: choice-of-anchor tandem repeat GloVer-containing protein [Candidatus Cybelea sp.]|jgi:uncharacterized repeat protein (TIGR03803 family)